MWTIPHVTHYIRLKTPLIVTFLGDCLRVFGWIILALYAGALLLYLFYLYAPPPIHPALWRPISPQSLEAPPP